MGHRHVFIHHRQFSLTLAFFLAWCAACGPAPSVPTDSGASDVTTSTDADSSPDVAPADTAQSTSCPCFDGDGTYCEADVAARANAMGCIANDASATGTRLLSCAGGAWSATATCASGCATGEESAGAACLLPVCDCFVRVSWCGASAARHALTLDPPCRIPLVPEHDTDILGCNGNTWVVLQACANGCEEAPTGTPDSCVSMRTAQDPGWAPCAHQPQLHAGLHPEASDRLRCAGVTSDRITQTIGNAAASAGYHAQDGTADGLPYTAAVDLSVRGMSETQIRDLLVRLGENGFAAWYRKPGFDGWPAADAPHIHAVFAGVVMKAALREQVRDYLAGRNGLVSHSLYTFWHATPEILSIVRLLFSRNYTP